VNGTPKYERLVTKPQSTIDWINLPMFSGRLIGKSNLSFQMLLEQASKDLFASYGVNCSGSANTLTETDEGAQSD